MKKNKTFLEYKLVILYCFLTTTLFSQVGINTVTPSPGSILDVESSKKGVLLPRLNITNLNTIAPVTGGATQSLLVYNTNATTGVGFHYWDVIGAKWVPLSFKDGDFHKVGTSLPPVFITDDVFRSGKVGLGVSVPLYSLDVENNNETIAARVVTKGSIGGEVQGLYVENSNSNTSGNAHYAIYSLVDNGSGTGSSYGMYNKLKVPGVNSSRAFAIYNDLTTDTGSGRQTGTFNRLTGTNGRDVRGENNYITGSGDGEHVGVYNEVVSTGYGAHKGTYNQVSGGGIVYGTHNTITGTSSGQKCYGTYNDVNSNTGTNIAGFFDAHGSGGATWYAAIFNRGKVIVNEYGGDYDFRVESDSDANMLFVNAGTNKIGIGTSNPSEKLEVIGTIKATNINFSGLSVYSSDSAAGIGGLITGDVYRTSSGYLKIKL